jgi:hypothetical protein
MPGIQLHKSWPDRIRLDLCIHVFWDVTHCRWIVIGFLAFLSSQFSWSHQTLKMKAAISFET